MCRVPFTCRYYVTGSDRSGAFKDCCICKSNLDIETTDLLLKRDCCWYRDCWIMLVVAMFGGESQRVASRDSQVSRLVVMLSIRRLLKKFMTRENMKHIQGVVGQRLSV